jgi:hypothetical protein
MEKWIFEYSLNTKDNIGHLGANLTKEMQNNSGKIYKNVSKHSKVDFMNGGNLLRRKKSFSS